MCYTGAKKFAHERFTLRNGALELRVTIKLVSRVVAELMRRQIVDFRIVTRVHFEKHLCKNLVGFQRLVRGPTWKSKQSSINNNDSFYRCFPF